MTATVEANGAQAPGAVGKARRTRDPRYLALRNFAISISVFNVFGYTLLGWEQPYLWPILALLTGYTTEIVFELISAWAYQRTPGFRGRGARGFYEFMLPSHITALACNMLLFANNQWWPVMFCTALAVSQKHVLRAPIKGKMRHFMNPSNLGIAITLLTMGTWVSISPPYQFVEWANTYFKFMVPLIILTAGTVLNAMLTKKVPLVVGWAGGFMIQGFVRHWLWGVQLNSALGVMTGVAFILFTNYMITDPATTPSTGRAMFMFGGATAFVYAALMEFNITYTLFYALCIVCGARGLGWWGAYLISKRRAQKSEIAGGTLASVSQTRVGEQAAAA